VVVTDEPKTMSTCARAACQRYIGTDGFKHKHLPWRYCLQCARKINAACPEAPPFDLAGAPADAAHNRNGDS
jgi:hypothetical protein